MKEVKYMKNHYHWIVCIGCMLMLFCNSGILSTGFAVFQPYMISSGGLTDAQASMVVTVRNLLTLLSMFAVGPYYRRLGYRLGISLACMIGAFSFVIYGLATSFPIYSIAASFAGFAFGIGGMIPVAIIIHNWFRFRGGLALGLCAMGTGISAIICPLVFVRFIENIGLARTFFLGAIFIAVIACVGFLLIRDVPRDLGLRPLEGTREITGRKFNATDAKKIFASKNYCIIAVIATFLLGAGINPSSSHLPVLYASEGIPSSHLSSLLALEGFALSAGKFLYGQAADHLGAFRTSCIFYSALITGSILSCMAGLSSNWINIVAMILLGLGYATSSVGFPTVASDFSAPEDYSQLVKRFQISAMAGSLLLNSIPGIMAEYTGDYIAAYSLLTALIISGTALIMIVYLHLNRARKTQLE